MLENIIKIIVVNGAVLIIPGVNFSLVSYVAMKNGLKFALASSMGIATAIVIHALFSMAGVNELFDKDAFDISLLRMLAGGYMIWLAKTVLSPNRLNGPKQQPQSRADSISRYFFIGFFVDIFNPYVFLFYISLFSGVELTDFYSVEMILYPAIIFFLVATWFIFISFLFSQSLISNFFNRYTKMIERIAAAALILTGTAFILGL